MEWNSMPPVKTTDELRELSTDEKLQMLDEMSSLLFNMANAFAMDKVMGVGTYLHESSNNISSAQKIIKGEAGPEIPMAVVRRALGYQEPMVNMEDLKGKDFVVMAE